MKSGLTLPKQLSHWLSEYGFVRDGWKKSRGGASFKNPKTGRRMRINMFYQLQICDGDFDRWANSVGHSVDLPRYQHEFRAAMETFGVSKAH
jgi:hypothetical protein